jgi:alanine dehydrogenase
MSRIIEVVEQAFRDWADDKAAMPPKAYLLVEDGDFRAMPAAIPGAAGVKWVNVHPHNPAKGLMTVMGTIIYSDPATGYPLAIIDGTDITAYRTGATSAIASKYLARKDSKTLGVIGAGRQAFTQILAHAALFKFDEIRIYDVLTSVTEKLIQSLPGLPLKATSAIDAVQSDIMCTVTPAHTPVVKKEWMLAGSHINAVGADAAGKEELEASILNDARVVVDDLRQASKAGEINVPITQGIFKISDVYANLGEIVAGRKLGRADSHQITVFDSTGVAIEDIATAKLIYQLALSKNMGLKIDFVEP